MIECTPLSPVLTSRFRSLSFLALTCAACLWSSFEWRVVCGQTTEGNVVDDRLENRNQRWLPLPSGRFPSVLELEKQLRPPGESNSRKSPNKSDKNQAALNNGNAPIDDEEVKQLQEIIKEFSDQLPPGSIPPDMGGLSHEAIARALQDPEVRKKAEQLMEQYARNGGELPEELRDRFAPDRPENNPATDPFGSERSNRIPSQNPSQVPQRNQLPRPIPLSPFPKQPTQPSQPSGAEEIDAQTAEERLFEQQQRDSPQQPSKQQREMVQSMEDFLKQVDESQTNDIKKQLDEKGFGSTLRSIVEQARRATEEQSARNASNNGAKAQAPKAEPVPSNRSNPPRSNPPTANGTSPNSSTPNKPPVPPNTETGSSVPRNDSGWGPWVSKMLTELNESVSKQPQQSSAQKNQPIDTSALAAPSFGDYRWPSPWVGILLLALFGLTVYWIFGRRIRDQVIALRETLRAESDLLRAPERIQNRADVVRAYHQLAYRIAAPVEDWWTHRIIARQACRNTPAIRSPMEIAVDVYEHARYLPAHIELTNDQLDSMRKAVKDCEFESK